MASDEGAEAAMREEEEEEERGVEIIADEFPVGMHVLAVDDDPVCLKVLEALLRHCKYRATTARDAVTALEMLRKGKNQFDLVISDVHMPDMDGLKLLEIIGLEMDIPVIMISADGKKDTVMKGILHGACDYMVKPARATEIKNIWQHVLRRRNPDMMNCIGHGCDDFDERMESGNAEGDRCLSSQKNKKPRMVWTRALHAKFVEAVNQIGIDEAVPRRIVEVMNVDGITRANVSSHLQKYRKYLKKVSSHTPVASGAHDVLSTEPVQLRNSESNFGRGTFVHGRISVPVGHLPMQSPFLYSRRPVQVNSSSTEVFSTNVGDSSRFAELYNCSNSWQTMVPSKFPDLGQTVGISVRPWQTDASKVSQLTTSTGSSGHMIPVLGNELRNQMGATVRNTTSVANLSDQIAQTHTGRSNNSIQMLNEKFALRSASITPAFPNLSSPVMPTQTSNAGGAAGVISTQEGRADVANGTDDMGDIFYGLHDLDLVTKDAFMDGDWGLPR